MCVCVWPQTHGDDVVLPEAQLVIVVTLKVEQRLCSSPPVTGHDEEVFVISLVALHGVVRSQILYHTQGRLNAPARHVLRTPGTSGFAGNSRCWSGAGPNSGSVLPCVRWPLGAPPPAPSALCSWISRRLPRPLRTAGSSAWTSCAGTVSSPPEHARQGYRSHVSTGCSTLRINKNHLSVPSRPCSD